MQSSVWLSSPFPSCARGHEIFCEGRHEIALWDAILEGGKDIVCRGGACGQCETDVVEADGTFEHRDHWLDDDDLETDPPLPA